MTAAEGSGQAEQVKAAAQAYVYGYPLVYNLDEVAKLASGHGIVRTEGFNTFGAARALLGPDAAFVSPNNDTLYLVASCDVSAGPLLLHVPDAEGRYYVLQLVDAWTNNFAYIGRRATGTGPADYLLAGPDFGGDVPDGTKLVRAPTGVFAIVGRVQVDGDADLPAVHALQDGFTLTPLEPSGGAGLPVPDPRVGDELGWWERFRVALDAFPPPAADAPYLAACEQLGLTAAETPYADPDPELAAMLAAGEKAGQDTIETLQRDGGAPPVNGWSSALHLFDYSLDYFELGTEDAPEWKIADRTRAYALRAVAARAGLWGNHGYEADYVWTFTDDRGEALNGANAYELRLEQAPPVDAFWSLTMYDLPNFYLVANPIDRYSLGDRTPGLEIGDDGSVTILMQADSPGPEKESNWLPTPAGDFRPILRLYQPRPEVLAGHYVLPAIRRIA